MDFFTVKEIAEILSVNEETVRRWIREKKLKAERGSGRQGSKIALESLKEFLDENKGLITNAAAKTLGITSSTIIGTGLAGIAVPLSAAVLAGMSWLSILKSKGKDKKDIQVELLEKELEFENMAMNLKNEIASKKHELELIEIQLAKIKEVVSKQLGEDKNE